VQRRLGCPFQRARLRYDSTFSLEAGYCYDHGIPYEEYLERWSDADRAKVTAVALENADRCNMCGSSMDEWNADPDAYEAVRSFCPGCMRRETMSDDPDSPVTKGFSVRLLPKATAAAQREEMASKQAQGTARPHRHRSVQ
jgi:hypothetical protein